MRPELTYDGFGINGPDEYRTRLCTFTRDPFGDTSRADHYGPMFAGAPAVIEAAERMLEAMEVPRSRKASDAWDDLRHAIAAAKGRAP